MSRASKVDRLPKEIRDKITQLRDGGRTINEIMGVLEKLMPDADISRSGLGRHLKKVDEAVEKMRRSRVIAESIGRSFGDNETGQVARANVELLHSMVMQFMIGDEEGKEIVLDPKDAMFMATALEKLAKASKSDLETQIKAAVEEERRAANQKAVEKLETVAKKQGISKETINIIKSSILGIET